MVQDIIELLEEGDLSLEDLHKIKETVEDRIDREECREFMEKERL